jgi:hypothetical protein
LERFNITPVLTGTIRRNVMKLSVRLVLGWTYFTGALTIITGLLHNAVISTQLPHVQSLTQEYQDGFTWLFLCTGTAIAFAGTLILYAARCLVRGESWARYITLASGLFLGLLGAGGAVLMMPADKGPLIAVVLAVMSLLPWWLMRRAATSY